jgi:hypothetical protein
VLSTFDVLFRRPPAHGTCGITVSGSGAPFLPHTMTTTNPPTMRAMVMTKAGAPKSVLELRAEHPRPVRGEDEVLIEAVAAGLNAGGGCLARARPGSGTITLHRPRGPRLTRLQPSLSCRLQGQTGGGAGAGARLACRLMQRQCTPGPEGHRKRARSAQPRPPARASAG